jgi:hypothetical protein
MDASLPHTSAGSSPPIGALGRELVRVQTRPALVSLGVAAVVGLAGPLLVLRAVEDGFADRGGAIPWIWFAGGVTVASLVLACAVVAFLPTLLLRGADRTATVVHSWVGAREIRRLFGSTSGAFAIPTNPEQATSWLAKNGETDQLRPLRFEALVMARRYDEARELISRYPGLTAFDEYRIVEAYALVDDQATGQVDEAALREAAERVPAGDDRAEAMASMGALLARRLVGTGDWRQPLVAARPYIRDGDVEILVRDFGTPIFKKIWPWVVLPLGGLVLLLATLITVMAIL